nr:MAG TPA: hypothetical protein [Bacteriophage sp.]
MLRLSIVFLYPFILFPIVKQYTDTHICPTPNGKPAWRLNAPQAIGRGNVP